MPLCHIYEKICLASISTFGIHMKHIFLFAFCVFTISVFAQSDSSGILSGNLLDERQKALEGATVSLIKHNDTASAKTAITDKDGGFNFQNIDFGYYKLLLSFV